MWSEFLVAFLAQVVVLFIPGYLLVRAAGVNRMLSVCIAPLVSAGMICVLGQVFALVGIASGPLTVLLPTTLAALAFFVVLGRRTSMPDLPSIHPIQLILMIGLGLALGYSLFVDRIPALDRVYQSYDITQHVNVTRAIADSGRFSSLGVNMYLTPADQAINPVPGAGFYPAGWHSLVALAIQITGASVPIAINASLFAFAALVYPLGCLAFSAFAFRDDPGLSWANIPVNLAFLAFPWCLFVFGPLYPNLASFAVVPAGLVMLMLLLDHDTPRLNRVLMGLVLLLSMAGMALLHPNAVFTLGVIFLPYGAHRIYQEASERFAGKRLYAIGFVVAYLLACAGVWYGCYSVPAMAPIVHHGWASFATHFQEIINILTLSYVYGFSWGAFEYAAQIPLAILVVIGIVRAFHADSYRWMALSYLFACFCCFTGAATEGLIKPLFSGFWYSDAFRLGAMASIAGVPLATLGLDWMYNLSVRLVRRYNGKHRETSRAKIAIVVGCLFMVLNYLPDFDLPGQYYRWIYNEENYPTYTDEDYEKASPSQFAAMTRDVRGIHTTFGDYRIRILRLYAWPSALKDNELAFMKQVEELVPQGAVVINDPMDGSFLTYGFNNVSVYYRTFTGLGTSAETPQSAIIRTSLKDIASNDEVKEAVQDIGAEYVLILSRYHADESFVNLRGDYQPKLTEGISSINNDTPGFELLLEDGVLKLYRITI